MFGLICGILVVYIKLEYNNMYQNSWYMFLQNNIKQVCIFFLGDSTAMENDIDNFIQHDQVKMCLNKIQRLGFIGVEIY